MADEKNTGVNRRALAMAGLGLAAVMSAPAAEAATARKISLQDRADITDLFSNYVWAYDCTDEATFIALFTADALVVGKGKLYRGHAEILGWFRYLIDMREREGDDIWMHEAGQFRFDPAAAADARSCVVHAYATHFNGNSAKNVRGVRSLGYFTCECRREADGWKFRNFSISPWDRTSLPWSKALPWAEHRA